MKTAISIDEALFRKAEKLSDKLNISRSQLFAQALEYLINKSDSLDLIHRLNAVYGTEASVDPSLSKKAKKKMKSLVGKW